MSSSKKFRKVIDMANGQSFGICLPKQFIVKLSIGHGDFVKVSQEEERIVIEKVNE